MFSSSWSDLTPRQFACAPELLSASKLDILVDERGGTTRVDGAVSASGGVNLTCRVYSDPEGEEEADDDLDTEDGNGRPP